MSTAPQSLSDQPWQTVKEWANPTIKSQAKSMLYFVWGFAVLWNAIAIPATVAALPEIAGGNMKALFVLLFPCAGMGLLTWAIVETKRWRRFGATPLTMDPHPGAIGGQMGGFLEVPLPYDPAVTFEVTLSCIYSYISGTGKNRRRSERVVWQREGCAYTQSAGGGTRVEVLFDVDEGLPPSEPQTAGKYHLWRLQIRAALPGADFDRSFEIPVFPTGEKSRSLSALSTEHSAAAEIRTQAIENVLDIRQIPGGVELYYPPFRHPAGKVTGVVVGILFTGAGIFAGTQGAPIIFPVLFPLMGGFVLLASLYSLLVSLRVRIDQQELRTQKRLLGIRAGERCIHRGQLRVLALKKGYSASTGKKHVQFYKLQVLCHSGESVTVGYNLPGLDSAEQALESLSMLTGLPFEAGNEGGLEPSQTQ